MHTASKSRDAFGRPASQSAGELAGQIERARVAMLAMRTKLNGGERPPARPPLVLWLGPECSACGRPKLRPVPGSWLWIWCFGCGHRTEVSVSVFFDVERFAVDVLALLRALPKAIRSRFDPPEAP